MIYLVQMQLIYGFADLWLVAWGPQGAFPLLVYPEWFRSCSAKKGSLVLPAHGLTSCVAPALRAHALVGAWLHISDRPWSVGLPGPRHLWSLAFNPFPETPKEIPVVECLSAQLLPAAQLYPRHLPRLLFPFWGLSQITSYWFWWVACYRVCEQSWGLWTLGTRASFLGPVGEGCAWDVAAGGPDLVLPCQDGPEGFSQGLPSGEARSRPMGASGQRTIPGSHR